MRLLLRFKFLSEIGDVASDYFVGAGDSIEESVKIDSPQRSNWVF